MNNETKRLSVKAGYCGLNAADRSFACAFEKSGCASSSSSESGTFLSSREMQGGSHAGRGGQCAWASTVKELTSDRSFGACQDALSGTSRCAWASEDCADGETYAFPVEDCTCDKVRVGGCEHNGEAFCAVSADGCDEDSAWFDPLGIVTETNTECYLCIGASKPLITDPPTIPPSFSTDAPVPLSLTDAPVPSSSVTDATVLLSTGGLTQANTPSSSTDVPLSVSRTGSITEGNGTVMIAALSLVACAVFVLFGTLALKLVRDKRKKDAKLPPTTTLIITDNSDMDGVDIVSDLDEDDFVNQEDGTLSQ